MLWQGCQSPGKGQHVRNTPLKSTAAPSHSWLDAEQRGGETHLPAITPVLLLNPEGRGKVHGHGAHGGECDRLPAPLTLGGVPSQDWCEWKQLTQVSTKLFLQGASSPCDSECGPWTSSIRITWECVRHRLPDILNGTAIEFV